MIAKMLGVSLQTLANWRVRETGPTPEPPASGKGNRVFYRLDEIASWLSDRSVSRWEVSCAWLERKGLVVEPATEHSTEFLIKAVDPFI